MPRRHCTPTVSVTTSHEDDEGNEVSITVECHVTPGEEPTPRTFDSGGEPGCDPEVEILSAEGDDGADWTERITEDRDWLGRVEERAIEAFGYAADDDADDQYEAARERRMGW